MKHDSCSQGAYGLFFGVDQVSKIMYFHKKLRRKSLSEASLVACACL